MKFSPHLQGARNEFVSMHQLVQVCPFRWCRSVFVGMRRESDRANCYNRNAGSCFLNVDYGIVTDAAGRFDRTTWTGTGDIVVMGVAATVKERLRSKPASIAYDILGRSVEIPILSAVPFPFIVIEPIAKPFGPDPETTRLSAPTRTRGTISTREEEWVAMYAGPAMTTSDECDPQTAVIECPGEVPGGAGPSGIQTPSGYSLETCYPSGGVGDPSLDTDSDGVVDQCEFELASVFAPRLQFDAGDCNTGREPYWAAKYEVSPIDNQPVIKIFYAISYYRDCGSPSLFCIHRVCEPHTGDSEFIIVEAGRNGPVWQLRRASLSAHFNVDGSDPIDTYSGGNLEYAGDYLGRPTIWVALGKHANYRSQSACDAGQGYWDTCDSPGSTAAIEILEAANLGRDGVRRIRDVGSRAGYPGIENYWSEDLSFRGWAVRSYAVGDPPTPYGKVLRFFGFD